MSESEADIARENVLVEASSKLYPRLELECEGKRAILLGGHEDNIDSINVRTVGGGNTLKLLSEWALEDCLGITDDIPEKQARRLTLTKPCVVAYGNEHVQKTPLLDWCKDMCAKAGIPALAKGSKLMVLWWNQSHDQQGDKPHTRGITWWPVSYAPKYRDHGVWFLAEVVRYDKEQATLHILYDYNYPDEKEEGQLLLPLNYVHFGDKPPPPPARRVCPGAAATLEAPSVTRIQGRRPPWWLQRAPPATATATAWESISGDPEAAEAFGTTAAAAAAAEARRTEAAAF